MQLVLNHSITFSPSDCNFFNKVSKSISHTKCVVSSARILRRGLRRWNRNEKYFRIKSSHFFGPGPPPYRLNTKLSKCKNHTTARCITMEGITIVPSQPEVGEGFGKSSLGKQNFQRPFIKDVCWYRGKSRERNIFVNIFFLR